MRQYWADIYENRDEEEVLKHLDADFAVNECGHYVQEVGGASRPLGRMDYQILYVASGRVFFWLDDRKWQAEGGSMLIYPPYRRQMYSYDSTVTSDVYWIHFLGKKVNTLLDQLDLIPMTPMYGHLPESGLDLWEQIIREMLYKRPNHQFMTTALACQLLTTLSRCRLQTGIKKDQQQELVEAMIDEINKNYPYELSVEQMARKNGMSVAWLNKRFKQYTGFSPQQYITKTRLSHARQMLSESAYNISEIAQMCGYPDPLYFSRLFHSRFGCSPKDFRQKR
ncbi:MAG: AraC family transcriptional regulator [Lachnospiraceae bacterium]|nr:helix-turn-helix transcriptional regulator [Candidatus Fimimorpha excrementavium]